MIFKLKDVNLSLPRGQLCAVVGAVGSGKSSLLQGLIGGESSVSVWGWCEEVNVVFGF